MHPSAGFCLESHTESSEKDDEITPIAGELERWLLQNSWISLQEKFRVTEFWFPSKDGEGDPEMAC